MAYASTTDPRIHTIGDMRMVTGTFTDGGTEVDFSPFLTTVFAAGGHLTSIVSTGIDVNNGNVAATSTVLTVSAVDARLHLAAGQTLYSAAGTRLGVIASGCWADSV